MNANEAAVVDGIKVYAVDTLSELIEHFRGKALMTPTPRQNQERLYLHNQENYLLFFENLCIVQLNIKHLVNINI